MKYIFIIAIFFASCQSDKKTALEGKWEFEKNETYPGVELNAFQDSMLHKVLDVQQKGLTLNFNGSTFKAYLEKNGTKEPMGEQPFVLTDGQQSLVLINKGRNNDTFPVVSLSDTVLKINMFYSKEGYLVFKKKK